LPQGVALVLALLVLAGTLAAAVVHSRWPIEAGAAVGCAVALVAVAALSLVDARHAIGDLGPGLVAIGPINALSEASTATAFEDQVGTVDGWSVSAFAICG
jgi:hypothetical protein